MICSCFGSTLDLACSLPAGHWLVVFYTVALGQMYFQVHYGKFSTLMHNDVWIFVAFSFPVALCCDFFFHKSFQFSLINSSCVLRKTVLGTKESLLADLTTGRLVGRGGLSEEYFGSILLVWQKRGKNEAGWLSNQLQLQVVFSKTQLDSNGLSQLSKTFLFYFIC